MSNNLLWAYTMFLKWNMKVVAKEFSMDTTCGGHDTWRCQYTDYYPWKFVYDYSINKEINGK
ncbi:MAG: hypothetical protein WC523_04005 [Patescibacteria group bacterium]